MSASKSQPEGDHDFPTTPEPPPPLLQREDDLPFLPESTIRTLFDELDLDHSGDITLQELHDAARQGRLGLLHSGANALMAAVDTDGSDSIDFNEFVAYVRKREVFLSNLFAQIDGSGEADGHITAVELQMYVSKLLNRQVSAEEAQKLLQTLDTDKSGTLEYAELVRGTLLSTGDAADIFRVWSHDPEHFYLAQAAGKTSVPTPAAVTVLAGLISGAITAAVVCPLDVLKTRLQVQRSGTAQKLGIVGGLRDIVAHEGGRGLYKGLSPSLIALLPNWAVYFTTYDLLKERLRRRPGGVSAPATPAVHMSAAAGAGIATILVTNPLWVVKTRIQTQDLPMFKEHALRKPYTGALNALYRIATEEGAAGLYSGLLPSLVGVAHVSIQFPLYEYCKGRLAERRGRGTEELQALDLVLASGFSKMVASSVTYPHEVVRSQMHITGTASLQGCLAAVRNVWREDGIRGYYRGCLTNLCRTTPAAALTFTSFELVSRALKKLFVPAAGDAHKR